MSVLEHIPSELWTRIISESFYVPLVFDDPYHPLDFFENDIDGLAFWLEQDYWESERKRCNLRLVCRSWKDFVDTKSHRMLKMWDFLAEEMPIEVLLNSQLVMFDLPPRKCGSWVEGHSCQGDCSPKWLKGTIQGISNFQWVEEHDKLLRTSFRKATEGNTISFFQSIRYLSLRRPLLDPAYIQTSPRHNNVVNLFMQILPRLHEIQHISTIFPRLVQLTFRQTVLQPHDVQKSDVNISFPFLQMLTIEGRVGSLKRIMFNSWSLPSFTTLRVAVAQESTENFLDMISSVSHQLLCLSIGSSPSYFVIDRAFWEALPKLEVMGWRPPIPETLLCGPPEGHPLSTLLLVPLRQLNYTLSHFFSLVEVCPSTRKIKIQISREWMYSGELGTAGMLKEFLAWRKQLVERSIEVVDINEKSFSNE